MVAEAEAVRDACFWCLRSGFLDAIIESDNASVIDCCILIDRAPPWEIASVVEDIHKLSSRAASLLWQLGDQLIELLIY